MSQEQRWTKGRLSTFDLYPGEGGGHGVQGQICHILTPASYESLPAPSGHRFPHFGYIHLGGGGGFWYSIDVEHSTYLLVSMPTSAQESNRVNNAGDLLITINLCN